MYPASRSGRYPAVDFLAQEATDVAHQLVRRAVDDIVPGGDVETLHLREIPEDNR